MCGSAAAPTTRAFISAPTRRCAASTPPAAGPRSPRRSQLLEDVYAYADYSYHGRGVGCEARTAVTPDTRKGYLISEFEGAQFPAKSFDDEPHRLAQALRYAAVLNDTIAQQGVAGSLGSGVGA